MDWHRMETHFSAARMSRYRTARTGNDAQAASDYSANVRIAEALFPMLHVFEVALRNGVAKRLGQKYGRADWWMIWSTDPAYAAQMKDIESAKAKLRRRKEHITPDKIVAELTFGFWCSLFNASHQGQLWKELRLVFIRCPKNLRRRQSISAVLNHVRELRNRTFHHEPLIWLTPTVLQRHEEALQAIAWIDPALNVWLHPVDRLPSTWARYVCPLSPHV